MKTTTTIKIEQNRTDPSHVGAFRVKLLTAGDEIQAGIRMTILSGGLGMQILPTTFHNLIWHIAYIERFVEDGPDWFFEDVGGKRQIINLLELTDTPLIKDLFQKWADWRSLLPGFEDPQRISKQATPESDVEVGEDPGDDD